MRLGYDQGVFGGIVVTPNFLETLGLVDNPSLLGTVIAIYNIGCFFGAIAAMHVLIQPFKDNIVDYLQVAR